VANVVKGRADQHRPGPKHQPYTVWWPLMQCISQSLFFSLSHFTDMTERRHHWCLAPILSPYWRGLKSGSARLAITSRKSITQELRLASWNTFWLAMVGHCQLQTICGWQSAWRQGWPLTNTLEVALVGCWLY